MRSLIVSITLSCLALAAGPAFASDFEATGSIHVKTNAQYASALKDGSTWEDTEYLNGGKTLIISEINLDKLPVTFTVIARDKPEFGPIEITAERKNFRKKRKGRTYSWVYQTSVRFKKAAKRKATTPKDKKAPAKAPAKPATPKKDEADDL